MIGFLRFAGILNVAVWLGAAFFYSFTAGPSVSSRAMEALLGAKYFPQFSAAILQVIAERYNQLQIACGLIAVCHMLSEWLYLGKVAEKYWRVLLGVLVSAALLNGVWIQSQMKKLHELEYGVYTPARTKEIARRHFRAWQSAAEVVNLLMVSGLGVYLWRVANPADPTRFVSPAKFRS